MFSHLHVYHGPIAQNWLAIIKLNVNEVNVVLEKLVTHHYIMFSMMYYKMSRGVGCYPLSLYIS